MPPHPDVLPPEQQAVLRRLGPFTRDRGFYLAGGTSIAIQLGHRRSIDLDWFTDGTIEDPLALRADLVGAGLDFDVSEVADRTLHGRSGDVRLSFLEYRYPALEPLVEWPEFGCLLAALEDLACMKLAAIANRGARRDFIDVYALALSGIGLERMVASYRKKYDVGDVAHLLIALNWFDDAEEDETPEMLWDVTWPDVRQALRTWVRELVPGPA
ncbi:MAG: nucleotidyl transferase AbiEii/AbiGii toxin family protein [Gemmatimonadota bacterium]|nr:nucleotidyl transferase AbiEii/AbiGii toxin family protein [Gemmatimonadota bacterium]